MILLIVFFDALSRNPRAVLYFCQAVTYGLAYWMMRHGRHAPSYIYLISCLIYLTLSLVHHG